MRPYNPALRQLSKACFRTAHNLVACSICCQLFMVLPHSYAQESAQTHEQLTRLTGQVELVRLVDLSAELLNLNIEYEPRVLAGSVTLRLGAGVEPAELWDLTNRLLASQSLTTVRMPGEETLSVVPLSDARGLSAVVQHRGVGIEPGFSAVAVTLEHVPPADAAKALEPLATKHGAVTPIPEAHRIIVSDITPRVGTILEYLSVIDVPGESPIIEQIEVTNAPAIQLAASVTAAVAARDTMTLAALPGKLTASPDGRSVVLVSPPKFAETWRSLVAQFDRRESVVTRTYSPRHFGLDEVARLLEQAARDETGTGSGDRWRLVQDPLTFTLLVTATPSEHVRIETLLLRLDEMPSDSRRPVRTFTIRNRSVGQIIEVLNQLIAAGALEGQPEGGDYADAMARREPADGRTDQARRVQDRTTQGTVRRVAPRPINTAGQAEVDESHTPRRRASSNAIDLTLTADEGTNTLIAVGDARLLSQIERLLTELDTRQPQVMVEVMVLSLSEGESLDLGVELSKLEISGDTSIRLTSLFGLGDAGAIDTEPTPGSGFSGIVLNPGDFSVVVRALQTISDGRAASMPKILVNNNETATLDSVFQEPFTTTNASNTVATTSFGGTSDAGTSISVTPQIAEADHLILEYSVTLSSFVGESTDTSIPPPRQTNNLTSLVTVPDGHTLVVGGLEVINEAEAVSQVPLLGSIPVLGEAFKNRSQSQSRSRFYVFIRCNVLRHHGFEDLKHISDHVLNSVHVSDGWPEVEPEAIH